MRSRLLARRRKEKESVKEDVSSIAAVNEDDLLEPFGVRPRKSQEAATKAPSNDSLPKCQNPQEVPSLEPYVGKLERFELFSTNQCYYLVACDKHNKAYRVLKMDRTLIERPPDDIHDRGQYQPETVASQGSYAQSESSVATPTASPRPPPTPPSLAAPVEASHNPKPTLRPLSDFLTEDPHIYSQDEIQDMLDMIHHGNRLMRHGSSGGENARDSGGGLKPIAKGYGVVGFIRFLDCYYLTLITRRAKVGSIGGNGIYTIKSTETFPLKPAERSSEEAYGGDSHAKDPSAMLLNMWNRGKRSVGLGLTNREIAELRYQGLYQVVDLHKNFYFSYTYDLTRSLQENFLATVSRPFPPPPFKDMFAWNYFLTRELEGCTNSLTNYHWIMPIIHGAFVQRKLNDYGRSLDLILLARRSRHFAGTRYLKRGVSDRGKVANDVEHEQIINDESSTASGGAFSSFLQVRGSIPTYWNQESSMTMPKPPIELNRVDPTYRATQSHFEDLLQRYGSPVVVLDLVKQSEKREREVRVGNEYRHAIDYINTSIDEDHKIRYCALDYSHISKHRHLDVSASLNEVSTWAVNQTGFFCSAPRWKIMQGGRVEPFDEENSKSARLLSEHLGVPVFPMEQRGVLRTNCIDCLDRTNVAQFSAGVEALEQQLVVMGIRSSANLDPSSNIVRVLIDMYVEIGDFIALQYGGSEAHKKVSAERSDIHGPMGKHKELLTSIRRYYSNAFTDRLKQDAMNLFLGYYVPYRHTVPLWDVESDYYLHNFHVIEGRGSHHTMKTHQRTFGIDWNDDDVVNDRQPPPSSLLLLASNRNTALPPRLPASPPSDRVEKVPVVAEDLNEPLRIGKVRKRCNAQNAALSVWWKAAIQSNFQQRMWIHLGRSPTESLLPPRFERLYQPDKLAQFDRFFSRNWATPARRSHSAQGESSKETEDIREYRRTIAQHARRKETYQTLSANENASKEETTIHDFVSEHGFEPAFAPSLKSFIEPHESKNQRLGSAPLRPSGQPEQSGHSEPTSYIGSLTDDKAPCDEYVKYAMEGSMSRPYRRRAVNEFSKCLHDTSLDHNDVDGIRKLAESAHIGTRIKSGPYRGLSHDESAAQVTTVISEQYNLLKNIRAQGGLQGELSLVDDELGRRGYATDGVKEAVATGWRRINKAEEQYSEILDTSNAGCRRSDLTSESSMRLYCSYFDNATLSNPEMSFILGNRDSEKPATAGSGSNSRLRNADDKSGIPKLSFAEKAARIGIPITSRSEMAKSHSLALFSFERQQSVPAGFEQINDDLFARKDNKFMVLNGAGVDSWQGMEPLTKISGIDEVLLA